MFRQPVSFLAFSCPHVPLLDEHAHEFLLDQLAKHQPDIVIHLGDGHEADSASRWPTEYTWDLADEYREHNAFLESIRLTVPKAKKIFCQGNHDNNLLSIARLDKKIRSLTHWKHWEPELASWEIIDYVYCRKNGCYRIGDVVFTHGFEAGTSADELQALYFANEYGLYVGGHTHRPLAGVPRQAMRTKTRPLRYFYTNPGCLRDLKPDYMLRQRSELWGHGVTIGVAETYRHRNRYTCNWEAETVVLRYYDEEVK